MPAYDYECTECGAVTRDHFKAMDDPHPRCAWCGSRQEQRFSEPARLGFWRAQAQEVWRETDPGNTRERCYGTRRIVVPRSYGGV